MSGIPKKFSYEQYKKKKCHRNILQPDRKLQKDISTIRSTRRIYPGLIQLACVMMLWGILRWGQKKRAGILKKEENIQKKIFLKPIDKIIIYQRVCFKWNFPWRRFLGFLFDRRIFIFLVKVHLDRLFYRLICLVYACIWPEFSLRNWNTFSIFHLVQRKFFHLGSNLNNRSLSCGYNWSWLIIMVKII